MHLSTNRVVLKEHSCNKRGEKASEVYMKCHKVERSSERGQTRRRGSSRRVSDGGAKWKRKKKNEEKVSSLLQEERLWLSVVSPRSVSEPL